MMSDDPTDDGEAYARSTDPHTSHLAAAFVDATKLQRMVWDTLIENGPLTTNQIAEIAAVPRGSITPRMKPMETKKMVERVGHAYTPYKQILWQVIRHSPILLNSNSPGSPERGTAAGLIVAHGDDDMSGLFGFSTEPNTGGDFLPIIKYDARAGRILRVDRVDQGGGNYVRQETDITDRFLAMADLENVEVGWINFPQGGAPHAVLVPFNPTNLKLPQQPGDQYKNGIRFLVKLHASCADGTAEVREVMTVAKAALNGIEELVNEFLMERRNGRHLDELPIIKLGSVTPVKTGSGTKTSTNYTPKFVVMGWNKRPSTFVFSPKGGPRPVPAQGHTQMGFNGGQQAPATGATRAAPPQQQPVQQTAPAVDVNDFG